MNYAAIAQSASEQIRAAGTAMTMTVVTAGTYDPATDTMTGGSSDTHSFIGLLKDVEFKWIDGTNIQATDQMALVGGSDLTAEPKPGMAWTVGDDIFSVVAWRPVRPGGTVVLHKVVLRAA